MPKSLSRELGEELGEQARTLASSLRKLCVSQGLYLICQISEITCKAYRI